MLPANSADDCNQDSPLGSLSGLLQSVEVLAGGHAARVDAINESLSKLVAEHRELLDVPAMQAITDFVQANQRMRSRFRAMTDSLELCEWRADAKSVPSVTPLSADVEVPAPLSHDRVSASLGNRDRLSENDANANRRANPRRPYPFMQHVAEYIAGQVLDSRHFREVRCHDLSANGFSYWAGEAPRQGTLIVRFGTAPDLTYLTAKVMHVTERNRGSQRRFLVGCQFLERVSISPSIDQKPPIGPGALP